MDIIWLWVIYIVIVLIVWAVLVSGVFGKIPSCLALLIASIIGLVTLLLIPQFRKENPTDLDKKNELIFQTAVITVPIVVFVFLLFSGEHKYFWNRGMSGMEDAQQEKPKGKTTLDATCDLSGNCVPTKFKHKDAENKTRVTFLH